MPSEATAKGTVEPGACFPWGVYSDYAHPKGLAPQAGLSPGETIEALRRQAYGHELGAAVRVPQLRLTPPYTSVFSVYMNDIVHARLDKQTRDIMRRLQRRHGWTDSQIIRLGISALADTDLLSGERAKRIVGLGEFASGVDDLGSNDEHLDGFGR